LGLGNSSAVHSNISSLASKANMRAGNVVMKAHSDSFMPEFSVSGSGAIPLQNNHQDNTFGAGNRKSTIVKMGGNDTASTFAPRVSKSLIEEMTDAEHAEFKKLPSIELDDIQQVQCISTISEGWAYPLNRFMNEQELIESMNMNTITDADGERHIQSVPITQYVTKDQMEALKDEKKIALTWKGDVLAVIEDPEFFDNRVEEISTKTFGTRSANHPFIARMEQQGEYLVSGAKMRFT
jgi:hypothetical protein